MMFHKNKVCKISSLILKLAFHKSHENINQIIYKLSLRNTTFDSTFCCCLIVSRYSSILKLTFHKSQENINQIKYKLFLRNTWILLSAVAFRDIHRINY